MSDDIKTGTGFDQLCPITGQPHRYFIFKTFEIYELHDNTRTLDYYVKKEYALLGCNCSSVVKQEVQQA